MNERLQQLFQQACWDQEMARDIADFVNVEQFAKLILAECKTALRPALRDMISRGQACDLIDGHFGVE